MINIMYLTHGNGAEKFGACTSCGKGSKDDATMVKITCWNDEAQKTSIFLCSECRKTILNELSNL